MTDRQIATESSWGHNNTLEDKVNDSLTGGNWLQF